MRRTAVPAAKQTESNMVGDFATTTLSGEAFTREQLGDVVFFCLPGSGSGGDAGLL